MSGQPTLQAGAAAANRVSRSIARSPLLANFSAVLQRVRNQYAEQGYNPKHPTSLVVSSALGAYREVTHRRRHRNYNQEWKSPRDELAGSWWHSHSLSWNSLRTATSW